MTWLRTYWTHLFGSIVAAAVGAPAAVASYHHGMAVIERSSDPAMAPWLPMTTDGLLLAALVALWVRRLTRRSTGWAPWAMFGLGLVVAIATNLAGARHNIESGSGWDVVEAVGWAVWPPVCLAVVLETIAWIVVPDQAKAQDAEDAAGAALAAAEDDTPAIASPAGEVELPAPPSRDEPDDVLVSDLRVVDEIRRVAGLGKLPIGDRSTGLRARYGVGYTRGSRLRQEADAPETARPHLVPPGNREEASA